MTRGRRPLTREVFSTSDSSTPVPSQIGVDTTFVVDALVPSQERHRPAAAYLERLIAAQPLLVFNRLLEVELVDTAFRLAIKEQHGGRRLDMRLADGRVRRRAGRLTSQLLESFTDILTLVPWLCVELEEVSEHIARDMQAWGIRSYDAVHVRSALNAGVSTIVTADHGFARVPSSELRLLVPPSEVDKMRAVRGSRSRG